MEKRTSIETVRRESGKITIEETIVDGVFKEANIERNDGYHWSSLSYICALSKDDLTDIKNLIEKIIGE